MSLPTGALRTLRAGDSNALVQPLHWAAGTGHAPIIDYLLQRRAGCAPDAHGSRPLHFAAAQDRLEAAQSLAACHTAGALPAAAAKGHGRLVRLLLSSQGKVASEASKDEDGKERPAIEVIDAQAIQETAARTVRGAQQIFGNLTGWVREAQSAVADSLSGLAEEGGPGPLAAILRRGERNHELNPEEKRHPLTMLHNTLSNTRASTLHWLKSSRDPRESLEDMAGSPPSCPSAFAAPRLYPSVLAARLKMTSKEQRKQWEAEQKTLAALRVQEDLLDWSCEDGFPDLHRVAGVDVSFFADGTYAIATVVVLSFPQLKVLWERSAAFRLSVPYVPGFLAFREVPALAQLMDSVPCALKPQVVLVDGNGAFHPRGCGAATHLGITVDLPTIGVAKDVLKVGEVNSSLARRVSLTLAPGQWASLCETALQLTRAICGTSAPEPVRQADLRSRRAVKAWHAGQEVEYLSNPRLRHLERVQAVQELAEQGELRTSERVDVTRSKCKWQVKAPVVPQVEEDTRRPMRPL
eukprot:g5035.t1